MADTRPRRVQRRRTRGWTMPPGAVYVGRPGPWGNPYRVERCRTGPGWRVAGMGKVMLSGDDDRPWTRPEAAAVAVDAYREHFRPGSTRARDAEIQLGGRDLACWCPLDQPCHVDVLLELANP